jgi:hypothetical protein
LILGAVLFANRYPWRIDIKKLPAHCATATPARTQKPGPQSAGRIFRTIQGQ